jgi:hypothetical protein
MNERSRALPTTPPAPAGGSPEATRAARSQIHDGGGGGRASAKVRGSVRGGERRGEGRGCEREGASGAVTHLVHVSLASKAGPNVTELHEGQHLRTEQRDFLG